MKPSLTSIDLLHGAIIVMHASNVTTRTREATTHFGSVMTIKTAAQGTEEQLK